MPLEPPAVTLTEQAVGKHVTHTSFQLTGSSLWIKYEHVLFKKQGDKFTVQELVFSASGVIFTSGKSQLFIFCNVYFHTKQ